MHDSGACSSELPVILAMHAPTALTPVMGQGQQPLVHLRALSRPPQPGLLPRSKRCPLHVLQRETLTNLLQLPPGLGSRHVLALGAVASCHTDVLNSYDTDETCHDN